MRERFLSLLIGFGVAGIAVTSASAQDSAKTSFNREVRPLLSDKCFTCHGPDEAARKSGIRLDVPGEADMEDVIERISSSDPEMMMPPPESEKSISKTEIETIKKWVNEGAEYEKHWAFLKPERPTVPDVSKVLQKSNEQSNEHSNEGWIENWAQNPIDSFTLKAMTRAGLAPSPPADRETLITRVSLDLIGLPPTPAEIQEFVNDESEDAFEKVVDRLLASPHYGERQALNWLDHARYADSNGYQSDGSRSLWPWRDWVIEAYNRNLPFDQFTIEQLAGDMLEDPTRDQIIATGFNRNHRLNGEGGRIVDEWFVETVIDRVETTGLTWMGLTFNCCRCHDHKYDPISQREFYQMFAFFNSVEESGVLSPQGKNGENTPPLMELTTAEEKDELARLEAAIMTTKRGRDALNPQLPALAAEWAKQIIKENPEKAVEWVAFNPESVVSLKGATMRRQKDGSYLAKNENPASDVYRIDFELNAKALKKLKSKSINAVRLTVLPHASLPGKSLGRGSNGNFVMTGFELEAIVAEGPDDSDEAYTQASFSKGFADFEQAGWTADSVLNPKPGTNGGWAIAGFDPKNRVERNAVFVLASPLELAGSNKFRITMRHDSPYVDHNVGRFKLSFTTTTAEEIKFDGADALPADVLEISKLKQPERSEAQSKRLIEYFKSNVPGEYLDSVNAVTAAKKSLTDYRNTLTVTMVMKERSKPRDAFILDRGEYDKPSDKVDRGLPSILPGMSDGEPMNRLGLARWIASSENPLTARVWVNRQWEKFFGRGIVKSTENFGSQADFPTHPDLFDWLAVEFMQPEHAPDVGGVAAQQWDMKAFHKLLVTSQTYRQSAKVTKEKIAKDPENILLSRGPRFRLTGELIRDRALAVSGLLVPSIGGPSVRPYMPEGVWDETTRYGNLRNYKHTTDDGLYRRTMYTIWKRTAAPPTMLLFDAPNRETCTIKRSRTNTPLQALALLNEVTFVEAARGLAQATIRDGGADEASRIEFAFERAIGRLPSDVESSILIEGLANDLKHFSEDVEAAKKLVAFGEAESEGDVSELAAYTMLANVILNLDEFVTRK